MDGLNIEWDIAAGRVGLLKYLQASKLKQLLN